MVVTSPFAEKNFIELWKSKLGDRTVLKAAINVTPIEDAISLGRMQYALTGSSIRGFTVAGQYHHKYIAAFGEYGFMTLTLNEGGHVVFGKSPSYEFREYLEQPCRRMDDLIVEAMLLGLNVSALFQWYDTVYRCTSGRHTSPNFDPVKSLDKSEAAIRPGMKVLESRLKGYYANLGIQENASRELKSFIDDLLPENRS